MSTDPTRISSVLTVPDRRNGDPSLSPDAVPHPESRRSIPLLKGPPVVCHPGGSEFPPSRLPAFRPDHRKGHSRLKLAQRCHGNTLLILLRSRSCPHKTGNDLAEAR